MSRDKPTAAARRAASVFAVPALLALATTIGLVAALLTEGPVDLLWSVVIAAPLWVGGWALSKRQRKR